MRRKTEEPAEPVITTEDGRRWTQHEVRDLFEFGHRWWPDRHEAYNEADWDRVFEEKGRK